MQASNFRNLKQLYFILTVILGIYATSACTVIDKKESLPAYLKIDSIEFKGSGVEQGTNFQNITEAWVFIDDNLQGIYDLPCEIPVLSLGEHQVKIRGGIKRNGISTLRVDYPFFNTYSTNVTFEALKTITIKPVVNYFSDVAVWDESFEDAGVKLTTFQGSDTSVFLTNQQSQVFEGIGSGRVVLSSGKDFCRFMTDQKFKLPFGAPVFAELHYRTNDYLRVGLLTHQSNGTNIYKTVVYLKPTTEISNLGNGWNKVYVNLSEEINKASSATEFDIYFEVIKEGVGEAIIELDNIKVVYPK